MDSYICCCVFCVNVGDQMQLHVILGKYYGCLVDQKLTFNGFTYEIVLKVRMLTYV